MNSNSYIVHLHGGRTHSRVIDMCKHYLAEKGAKVKDEAVFGMKHNAPSVPDIWAVYEERIPMGGGKYRTATANLIVEVESHPTKESVAKKRLQYEATLAGCNLLILDLEDCAPECLHDWNAAYGWFEERMPI
jgi:hypothetical protein